MRLSLFILFTFLISPLFAQTKVLDHINSTGGKIIGYNYYDYLSGGAAGEKLIRFTDGTMLFSSMAAVDTNLQTRGSYYNYYNGDEWIDTSIIWHRIEKSRRGWTQIAAFSNKKAFIMSHAGLELNTNTGTPDIPVWTGSIIPGTSDLAWPKIAADDGEGHQDLYITAGTSEINGGPFLRSTDAGATWEPIKYLIDTTSSDWREGRIFFSADNMAIAARNGKVAILSFTANGNVTLFYSENRGESFLTKTLYRTVDHENSVSFDSSLSEHGFVMTGIGVPDGTGDVHIDMQGRIHCAWANREFGYVTLADSNKNPVRDSLGRLQPNFFVTDWSGVGISYWNSEIDTITAAALPDLNTDLVELDNLGIPHIKNNPHDRALIGRPSMGSDIYGSLHMVFEGFGGETGLIDGIEYPYNHIYITATHGGLSWSGTQEVFEYFNTDYLDMSYPVLPDYIDGDVNIAYQIDDEPGNLAALGYPAGKNYLVHTVFQHIVNDAKPASVHPESFYVSDAYPNPFNHRVIFNYETPSEGVIRIQLYNALGELIRTVKNEVQPAGKHNIRIDMRGLSTGIYYCSFIISSDSKTMTAIKKMIYLK